MWAFEPWRPLACLTCASWIGWTRSLSLKTCTSGVCSMTSSKAFGATATPSCGCGGGAREAYVLVRYDCVHSCGKALPAPAPSVEPPHPSWCATPPPRRAHHT